MTYPRTKDVTLLDTQTLLSKYSCVLTDTNSVCCTIITEQLNTYDVRIL
jgi:hypothetical protein